MAVTLYLLVEQLDGYLWGLKHCKGLHDGDIHQPIAHTCRRCYIDIVAILAGVGTGNKKGIILFSLTILTIHLNLVSFGLVFQSLHQRVFYIRTKSALGTIGKLAADKGIEPHTTGTEKRSAVDATIIQFLDNTFVQHLQSTFRIHGDIQMARQSVSASAGNNAQSRLGVDERAGNLIYGSISSNSHYNIHTIEHCFTRKFGCMATVFSIAHFCVELFSVHEPGNHLHYPLLIFSAGNGIYQKPNRFLFHLKITFMQN